LDTFGVHAVGGTLGAFLTGVLATSKVNANLDTNLKGIVGSTLWIEQLKAIGVTLCLAIFGTLVIAYALKAVMGLRVNEETEMSGLDLAEHGEEGYHDSIGGTIEGAGYSTEAGSILATVDKAIKAGKKGEQTA